MLTAKILTECVRAGAPTGWLVFVGCGTGCFALSQVITLNAAVGRYSPLLIVPIFTAASLLTNASGGGIYFKEFAAFTPAQGRAYGLGVTLLLSGVALIASKAGGGASLPAEKKEL